MEVLLGAMIITLGFLLAYEKFEHRRTIDKMTNALIAKDARELKELDIGDKLKLKVEVPAKEQEDLIQTSDLSDKEFNEHIIGDKE